jgi:uncharacterized membrane protein YfcA
VPTLLLALIVCAAFTVESALGFGATVITVSLGARVLPVRALLPVFVPLNVALSLWLAARNRRDIDRALLGRRVLPLMLLGMPLGMLLVRRLSEPVTRRVLGALVIALSVAQLAKLRRGDDAPSATPAPVAAGLLTAAGVVHGMFGAGGPLAVYVIGRALPEKARFRATLSALWLALNAVLVGGYALDGALTARSLETTALLVPALALGITAGEWLHGRVPERTFRTSVYVVLLVVGGALIARS